jgi:hypothetical protein
MNNPIPKKNSLRSAQITRMLDKAQWIILEAGQTLEDETWLMESTRQGIKNANTK